MSDTAIITESEILADVIAVDDGNLPPEVAKSLLNWKFTDKAVARMNQLSDRNNKGTLTDTERDELERYLRVGTLINLIQAKARRSLDSAGSSKS